jgi:hypothetical protein
MLIKPTITGRMKGIRRSQGEKSIDHVNHQQIEKNNACILYRMVDINTERNS